MWPRRVRGLSRAIVLMVGRMGRVFHVFAPPAQHIVGPHEDAASHRRLRAAAWRCGREHIERKNVGHGGIANFGLPFCVSRK